MFRFCYEQISVDVLVIIQLSKKTFFFSEFQIFVEAKTRPANFLLKFFDFKIKIDLLFKNEKKNAGLKNQK